MDREGQASLVRDDDGDDGLENCGKEGVDAKDQGTELLGEGSRNLEAEEDQEVLLTMISQPQGKEGPRITTQRSGDSQ